jgi:hypothetical protein
MKGSILLTVFTLAIFLFSSCKKEKNDTDEYQYYEVGFKSTNADWRDTSFVVRTSDQTLIQQIEAQLLLPVNNRKLVAGTLVEGNGGYNKNGSHEFKWHFKEDNWQLADVTIEIYDGKPYTDVDVNLSYWLNTVKRFGSWGSYIKRRLPGKP